MIWVGLDFFNSLFGLSASYEFPVFNIIKYLLPIITLITFLAFFLAFKINHLIFKIYIFLRCIILPISFLFSMFKNPILYGTGFDIPVDIWLGLIFTLIIGLVLLFFYRKFKIEN